MFIFIISLSHWPRQIPSCYSVASQLGRHAIKFSRLDLTGWMTEAHRNCTKNHIVSVLQRLRKFELTRLARAGLDWCARRSFHHLMPKLTSTTSADVEYWTMECPSLEQNKGRFTYNMKFPCRAHAVPLPRRAVN